MTRVVLLTGLRPISATEPVLRADDLGVLYGESAFETVRIAGGRPTLLAEHLQRLSASAARLDVALPDGFAELAEVASVGCTDAVLRLVCTKGPPPVGYALVSEIPLVSLQARREGVRAITLALGISAGHRAAAPWLLGGVKTSSYAVNMAALRHAKGEGADDAIWLSSDGFVLEGPAAAVAVVRDGVLLTPPPSAGILASTTLAAVLALHRVPAEVRPITADELRGADEILMMSSIRGVVPVVELDGQGLAVGPVTRELGEAFETSLRSTSTPAG